MGKLVVAMYLTLDGIMESPSWTAPYWEDELAQYQDQAQKDADALLLGRVTYQQFAAAWPESRDEGAPFMNAIPKYVPTTTLKVPEWQAVFLHRDALAQISQLKDNKNLLVYGSATLTRALFEAGLVDEYREMVFPLLLGKGKRLFDGEGNPFAFTKVKSSLSEKGVLLNTYSR